MPILDRLCVRWWPGRWRAILSFGAPSSEDGAMYWATRRWEARSLVNIRVGMAHLQIAYYRTLPWYRR